ncbi:DUF2948 family protein [Oceaniovalibus sp. ACAM 378]|uniref:DUF2948 family protein n=1 Tax=Oceaniovalibus sp. ACAM 378 TaxID=2599923 RepID=UPI0011D5032E|nr:DUF2948 family protein [Oceaniovalibus sp. ACAM 378]TYB85817.1 DUF2948 family protein [Oceaniovalibus sp. ACAM 378]
MTEDARFEDGAARPLQLSAISAEDLAILSSLVQDAVFPANEMTFKKPARRFAMLINRFRWEEKTTPPERVQAVLSFENVTGVQTSGVTRGDSDTVLSLLSVTLEDDGDRVILTLAGDGAIALDCSALEVSLRDVTQPYRAVSGKAPHHPD